MMKEKDTDAMRPEYDFKNMAGGKRGKYYKAYREGHTVKRHFPQPIPETFASEKEAGEFWDAHSTGDYEEYLEPVDVSIDIQHRRFEIEQE